MAVAAAVLAAVLIGVVLTSVGFYFYYSQSEHYRALDDGIWFDSDVLTNLKIAFYGIVAVSAALPPILSLAFATWLRAPKAVAVVLTVAVVAAAACPVLWTLSFANACNLAESFPFPGLSC